MGFWSETEKAESWSGSPHTQKMPEKQARAVPPLVFVSPSLLSGKEDEKRSINTRPFRQKKPTYVTPPDPNRAEFMLIRGSEPSPPRSSMHPRTKASSLRSALVLEHQSPVIHADPALHCFHESFAKEPGRQPGVSVSLSSSCLSFFLLLFLCSFRSLSGPCMSRVCG